MLQRLIAAVLAVLGLAAIALGIASATLWRADDTLTATARTADGTTLLTTAPGVLTLGDPPVTIRATADPGTKVVLAMGRDTDVAGWVGTDAHTVVTGLSDWHTLATDTVESTTPEPADAAGDADAAEPAAPADPAQPASPADGAADAAAASAPDPDGSDLWVDQATGDGEAELVWTPRDGRWTLLVAGAGEDPAPVDLTLSWPQTVTTPWLVPGVVGGVVLLLLAAVLAVAARRRSRAAAGAGVTADGDDAASARSRRERRAAAAGARSGSSGAARTGEVPTVAGGVGTAALAADRSSGTPGSGGATGREALTGEVPVSEGVTRSRAASGATRPDEPATHVVPGAAAPRSADASTGPDAATDRPDVDSTDGEDAR